MTKLSTEEKVDLLFRLITLEARISDIREEKNGAVKEQKFDRAGELRQDELSAIDAHKMLIEDIKTITLNP